MTSRDDDSRPAANLRPGSRATYTVEVRGFATRELARQVAGQLAQGADLAGLEVMVGPGNDVMSDRTVERVTAERPPD